MKRIIYLAVINFLYLIPCAAQENAAECPTVKFVQPTSVTQSGKAMPFEISLSDEARNLKLQYKWFVSAGEIIKGQGTNSIEVTTTEQMNGTQIIATVEINGLSGICKNIFSETGSTVAELIVDPAYFEYEASSFLEERAELDPLIIFLTNEPDFVAIFYLTLKNPTDSQINYRIRRIFKAFAYRKVQLKDRTIFVVKKGSRNSYTISTVTRGKINISLDEDEIIKVIKGSYFKPAKLSKRK